MQFWGLLDGNWEHLKIGNTMFPYQPNTDNTAYFIKRELVKSPYWHVKVILQFTWYSLLWAKSKEPSCISFWISLQIDNRIAHHTATAPAGVRIPQDICMDQMQTNNWSHMELCHNRNLNKTSTSLIQSPGISNSHNHRCVCVIASLRFSLLP